MSDSPQKTRGLKTKSFRLHAARNSLDLEGLFILFTAIRRRTVMTQRFRVGVSHRTRHIRCHDFRWELQLQLLRGGDRQGKREQRKDGKTHGRCSFVVDALIW